MPQPVGNGPAVRDLLVGRGRAARMIDRGVRGDFLSGPPVQLDVRADVIVPQVDVRTGVAALGPVEADTVNVVSLVHDVVFEVDLHGTGDDHPPLVRAEGLVCQRDGFDHSRPLARKQRRWPASQIDGLILPDRNLVPVVDEAAAAAGLQALGCMLFDLE